MRTHELARILLERDDCEVTASVDMSTCDEDSGNRVFGDELCEVLSLAADEQVLLFASSRVNY